MKIQRTRSGVRFLSKRTNRKSYSLIQRGVFVLLAFTSGFYPENLQADSVVIPANSNSAGIKTGTQDDVITVESGAIVSTSDPKTADTTAAAAAVAIDAGDGVNLVSNAGNVGASTGATAKLAGGKPSQADATVVAIKTGVGSDTITNSSVIAATSISDAKSSDIAVTLTGDSSAESATRSTAKATGLSAGAGADTLINTGSISASSTGTASATNVDIRITGLSSKDASTLAQAEATAMAGGDGVDTLDNRDQINATAVSDVKGVGVTASDVQLNATSSADAGLYATSNAWGMTGDGGNDILANNGSIKASSTATASSTGVELMFGGVSSPQAATIAHAIGTGMAGGDGEDNLINNKTINSSATATTSATEVSVSALEANLGDSEDAGTKAVAESQGMSGGAGNDTIANWGAINAETTAGVTTTKVTIKLGGYSSLKTETSAQATTTGIDGGDGADNLSNHDSITAKATSTVSVTDVSVSGLNVKKGPSEDAGARSITLASGMSGGTGDDTLTNWKTITATSSSTATATTVDVQVLGLSSVIASTQAEATSKGIDGGEGVDAITNASSITADAAATSKAWGVSAALYRVDAVTADTQTKSIATALGVSGGTGNDSVVNASTGTITAKSSAKAGTDKITAEYTGFSGGNFSTSSEATAMGIDGGDGDDMITNRGKVIAITNSGKETANGPADTTTLSIEGKCNGLPSDLAQDLGMDFGSAETLASAKATGLEGGQGADTITNVKGGTLDVQSGAKVISTDVGVEISVTPNEKEPVKASVTAELQTEAAASAEPTVVAASELTSVAESASGTSEEGQNADASTSAISTASGISGGAGDDYISNAGKATVFSRAQALSTTVGVTVSNNRSEIKDLAGEYGLSDTVTEAQSTGSGISGGEGVDTISNSGELEATAEAKAVSTKVTARYQGDFNAGEGIEFELAVVATKSGTETTASAAGIEGGKGGDTIMNTGKVTVSATPETISTSTVVDIVPASDGITLGGSYVDVGTKATSTTKGIDGGAGSDSITNQGEVGATATSTATNVGVSVALSGVFKAKEKTGIVGDAAIALGNTESTATTKAIVAGEEVAADSNQTTSEADDDSIVSSGKIGATATANAYSTLVSVPIGVSTGKTGLVGGGSYVQAKTFSTADAAGIESGRGDDHITTTGQMDATATAKTVSTEVTLTAQGVSGTGAAAGLSILVGSTESTAAATGIKGGTGNDTISNGAIMKVTGDSNANAVSVGLTVAAAKEGMSLAGGFADISSTAKSTGMGIDGGAGADVLANTGTIEILSVAKNVTATVGVTASGTATGVAAGVSLADATCTATSTATGISGGESNDQIDNSGTVTAASTADTTGATVTVNLAVTKTGLTLGVAAAKATLNSNTVAVGVDGGVGDDRIQNIGSITTTATSTMTAANVSVDAGVAVSGVAAGAALVDGQAISTSLATGMKGDGGSDTLVNWGVNTVNASSTVNAASVGLKVSGTTAGFAAGASVVDGQNKVEATAVGLSGADGEDAIFNYNKTKVFAETHSTQNNVSLTITAAIQGAAASGSFADATNNATATATGIDGGSSNDILVNNDVLQTDALTEAKTASVAAQAAISGNLVGVGASLASAETTGTAKSTGVFGDAGDDRIENQQVGQIFGASSATARATGISLGLSTIAFSKSDISSTANAYFTGLAGADGNDTLINWGAITKGTVGNEQLNALAQANGDAGSANLTGYASADVSIKAKADTLGMEGAGGDDKIYNKNTIDLSSKATAKGRAVSINLLGAVFAKGSTTAESFATGMSGGEGADTASNSGSMALAASSSSDMTGVSVTLGGYANADGSSLSNSTAAGIDGGEGSNVLTNENGGTINVTSTAEAKTGTVAVTLVGGNHANAEATANAAAYGLQAGKSADALSNYGRIDVAAESTLSASSTSVAISGAGTAEADSTAKTLVAGLDAGAGANTITNGSLGVITAKGLATAKVENVVVTVGVSGVSGSTTAIAQVAGIKSGDDKDSILNAGAIQASAKVKTTTAGGSLSLVGVSSVDSNPSALVEGVSSGGGDDLVQNTGSITVGSVSTDPLVYSELGTVKLLTAVDFSSAQFAAKVQTAGINSGTGDDTIFNQGTITVGTSGWMADGKAGGFSIKAVSLFDMTTVGSRAQTISTGLEGCAGADAMANDITGQLTVFATSHAKAISTADTAIGGSPAAFATGTTQSTAKGISGGAGVDVIENRGTMDITAKTQAEANAGATVPLGQPVADATANATATANGVDATEGRDTVTNSGRIVVNAQAEAKADANVDSAIGTNESDATANSWSNAYGVQRANDGGETVNSAKGVVEVHSFATGTSKAAADEKPDALAYFYSDAAGIQAKLGNNSATNLGQINVTSGAGALTAGAADTHSIGSSTTNTAISTSKRGGTASARGISFGDGNNTIGNQGIIDVTATNTAFALADYSSEHLDHANAYSGAGGTTLRSEAVGIAVGNGTNTIESTGSMKAKSTLSSTADAHANTTSATNYAEAYAGGTAWAAGVSGGSGQNTILLSGSTKVTSTASANAAGHGEDYGNAYVGSETAAGIFAEARGVAAGGGNNVISNKNLLQVISTSTATALGWAHTYGDSAHGKAYANSYADSIGILTGDGNNQIVNNGTISVSATANASASVDVHSTWSGEARDLKAIVGARAIGIQTGGGDDVVENYGTITTSTTLKTWYGGLASMNTTSRGTAIATGAGNDRVVLGAGSATTGDINLGDGNDTLMFRGTAVVSGTINPGEGSNSLVFDGAGSLNYAFTGFENTTKQGAGAFSLASLLVMKRLAVSQGILEVRSSYTMDSGSSYTTVVNSDGSHGQLTVRGTLAMDGSLTVARDRELFVSSRTYDIITANAVQGKFATIALPKSTRLLSFSLRQDSDRVEVEALVKSFTTDATNQSHAAVGDYLDRIAGNASGELRDILVQIQNYEDARFAQTYDSLSSSSYDQYTTASFTGAQLNFESLQQRLSMAHSARQVAELSKPVRLASLGRSNLNQPPTGNGISGDRKNNAAWVSGLRQWGKQKETAGFAGSDLRSNIMAAGYERILSTQAILGASVSKGKAHINLNGDAGAGSVENISGMVYGGYDMSSAYFESALSYGRNTYENHRMLTIGSDQRLAEGKHNGDVYSGYVGGGYFFKFKNWSLGPSASARYVALDEEGFSETGAGSVNLLVNQRSTRSLVSELGLRSMGVIELSQGSLIPEVSLGLAYDFDIDDRVITAAYEGSPNVSFSVGGRDIEKTAVTFGGGVTWMMRNGVSASLKYKGEYRDADLSQTIYGQVGILF